jgi:hypothetical protein
MNARAGARLGLWFELCLWCCIGWAQPAQAMHAAPRTAFYYGARVPSDLILAYDQIVVEPDHVTNLEAFRAATARPVAYLSVGEVARASARSRPIDEAWVLAENRAWASRVMDLESPGYQAWLLSRFEQLWAQGYRGFFLDTLDSYRLAAAGREAGLRRSLVQIIRGLAERHPGARLLLNRGFEVLPELKDVVSGVVAESLFDRWDAATQSYRQVPEVDRRWLGAELTRVRDELGLPVTVIDYRPEAERPQARETARRIAALGFEPWVTNATLDGVGIGSLEILPRRVLILHDGESQAGAVPDGVRFLTPVLEYLGYVPEPRRVPQNLAELTLDAGYQGVITWFSSTPAPGFSDWMAAWQRRGVRFVLFGVPGFDIASPRGRALGLSLVAPASASAARVVARDALVGFEAEPPSRPFDGPLVALADAPGNLVHLRLRDAKGRDGVAIATTAWGGFALSHVLALRGLAGERAWVIDPVAFLRRALSLPGAPMPNVTTQNGRRLALLLVRPEGLATLAGHGQPTNAAALGAWLARDYPWPHAVATRPSDPAATLSAADAAAAQGLLELPFFERADLAPGHTRAQGGRGTLTELSGLAAGGEVVGPIALDSVFLPSGGPQAYPYRDVLQTFEYTGTPRRLAPTLVDYHGYLLGSPGGRAALGRILGTLGQSEPYPLFVSEYAARVRAFAQVVVARALDGSFHYFGGEAVRTVRSPLWLGWPRQLGAGSAVVVRRGPDGIYSSFPAEGPRRLTLGAEAMRTPHLAQVNGRVLAFERAVDAPLPAGSLPAEPLPVPSSAALPPARREAELVRFELDGHVPLELELAGLPPNSACALAFEGRRELGVSDERGALKLALGVARTGEARLYCLVNVGNG